ncbi:MAG: hypothetical protein HC821_04910 [Lewinella sp.]|nr:hypothetical protein [Lewinella sp.]
MASTTIGRFSSSPAWSLEIFKLSIFDRWGTVVYTSNDQAEGWSGYSRNKPAAAATYTWVLQYHFIDRSSAQFYNWTVVAYCFIGELKGFTPFGQRKEQKR